MAKNFLIPVYFTVIFFITRLKSTLAKSKLKPKSLFALDFAERLRDDPESLQATSSDFGKIVKETPLAVLFPASINDLLSLISFSYNSPSPFPVSARGRGHSIRGQATARNGIVVDMSSMYKDKKGSGVVVSRNDFSGYCYADVGGGELWIDVLHATLKYGVAPVSWTDYLYITVGGTLSNAGISGQSFRYGPQISNVLEMDVVTGKGELVTCCKRRNSELFHAVLGGLGQFGVIARARIALEPAPKRVKWVRMLYSSFSAFSQDQERLISINGRNQNNALGYLEGFLLMHRGQPNNWRSSFFPPSDSARIISLVKQHGIIYCLEAAKYYDDLKQSTVDQELETLFQGLEFISGFRFEKDVSYTDFLDRVHSGELKLQSQGLWDVPHPWLNLFVPKSRISDFNSGVFKDIVMRRNITTGPVLIYPMNKSKWDDRTSAIIPDEDVFYAVGFLHSSGFDDWKAFDEQNQEILNFCVDSGIKFKQYLPHYRTSVAWMNHFGSKWRLFLQRKKQFDPKLILSPGQRIFNM